MANASLERKYTSSLLDAISRLEEVTKADFELLFPASIALMADPQASSQSWTELRFKGLLKTVAGAKPLVVRLFSDGKKDERTYSLAIEHGLDARRTPYNINRCYALQEETAIYIASLHERLFEAQSQEYVGALNEVLSSRTYEPKYAWLFEG